MPSPHLSAVPLLSFWDASNSSEPKKRLDGDAPLLLLELLRLFHIAYFLEIDTIHTHASTGTHTLLRPQYITQPEHRNNITPAALSRLTPGTDTNKETWRTPIATPRVRYPRVIITPLPLKAPGIHTKTKRFKVGLSRSYGIGSSTQSPRCTISTGPPDQDWSICGSKHVLVLGRTTVV